MDELEPMPGDWNSALAIVAHPDDLEYGAAGAVAAWTDAGKDVRYLMVTRGEAGIDTMTPAEAASVREAEEIAGAAEVGVSIVEFLNYRDGAIQYSLDLRRDLAAAIRRHRPELFLLGNFRETFPGGGWNMADHRETGRAAMDAIADAGNRWIFPDLEGEPWNGVKYVAVSGSPVATHAVDITSTVERSVRSLEAHEAYLAALGDHPMASARDFLEWMAELAGARFGGRKAAAFELFRR
jgi:LmbE family N-acetylglucosaminyl deacetylase